MTLQKPKGSRLRHLPHAAAALALGAMALASSIFRSWSFVHDDSYILLRYVRNLLDGHGLVWNIGEAVEGYSSFTMVVLVSLGGVAGLDLLTAARIVNLLGVVVFSVYVAIFCYRRSAGTTALAGVVPVLLLWSFPGIPTWICGGLEAPLFASIVGVTTCLVWDLLERPTRRLAIATGVALSLTVLTRPEGLFFVAVALLVAILRLRSTPRAFVVLLVTAVIPILAHLAWRLSFYGEWLPNPVHAKLMGTPVGVSPFGLHYVSSFVAQPPFLFALALFSAVFALWKKRERWGNALTLASAVGFTALVGAGGGDHMAEHRMLLPTVALSVVLIGSAVAPLAGRLGAVGAGVVALALVANAAWTATRLPNNRRDLAAQIGRSVAEHIRDRWPEGTIIALNTAGSIPYFAERYHYIDMLGLNDIHIARRTIDAPRTPWQSVPGHMKGDGQYVLGRHPEVIVLGGPNGSARGMFLSDAELLDSDLFRARYRMVTEAVIAPLEIASVTMPVVADPAGPYLRTRRARTGPFKFTYFVRIPSE